MDESPDRISDPATPVKKGLKAEMIVGIAAIVVSVMTMFVYIFQAGIMMDQQHMSVWPYLEWSPTYISTPDEQEFYLAVINKGVGPARVKDVKITFDDKKYDSYIELLQDLFGKTRHDSLWIIYSSVSNRVLAPGEEIKVFHAKNANGARIPSVELTRYLKYSICYCNIYDDCWTTYGMRVEESECD
jgi:hypothetical protein